MMLFKMIVCDEFVTVGCTFVRMQWYYNRSCFSSCFVPTVERTWLLSFCLNDASVIQNVLLMPPVSMML